MNPLTTTGLILPGHGPADPRGSLYTNIDHVCQKTRWIDRMNKDFAKLPAEKWKAIAPEGLRWGRLIQVVRICEVFKCKEINS